MDYDIIIIGAGIAGLRIGIETLKKKRDQRCCILEKYNYNGGRIVTYHGHIRNVGSVQWENGAGRISTTHTLVLALLKKYGLTTAPLPAESNYNRGANHFTELLPIFLQPLHLLPPNVLRTHTLKQLLDKLWGSAKAKQFYLQFPYYSEIHVLRADIALEAFQHEMRSNAGFVTCKEGLSALIACMVKEFEALGGIILQGMSVTRIQNEADNRMKIECCKQRYFHATTCVLALHSEAVKRIKGIHHMPVLRHLKMQPLLRIYAVFPVTNASAWFTNLPKIITKGPLRHIIPINAKKGIIMISYTEGKDTVYWLHHNQAEQGIMREIRNLYPDRDIPDPIFFKMHPWHDGTTYWLPGNYSVDDMSRQALHPLPREFPRLFMCGESFAKHQAWIESAIEHADLLLETHAV